MDTHSAQDRGLPDTSSFLTPPVSLSHGAWHGDRVLLLPSSDSQSCCEEGSVGRARALYSNTTELEMIWLLKATCRVTRPVSWAERKQRAVRKGVGALHPGHHRGPESPLSRTLSRGIPAGSAHPGGPKAVLLPPGAFPGPRLSQGPGSLHSVCHCLCSSAACEGRDGSVQVCCMNE